jgi:hypothetical protein
MFQSCLINEKGMCLTIKEPLTLCLQGMICNAVEKGELVVLVEMRL